MIAVTHLVHNMTNLHEGAGAQAQQESPHQGLAVRDASRVLAEKKLPRRRILALNRREFQKQHNSFSMHHTAQTNLQTCTGNSTLSLSARGATSLGRAVLPPGARGFGAGQRRAFAMGRGASVVRQGAAAGMRPDIVKEILCWGGSAPWFWAGRARAALLVGVWNLWLASVVL